MDNFVPIGQRIAHYRERRGLSQVKLAGLVGRSESWLSQIERGVRPIDRLRILGELASVLEVPVTELTGSPPRVTHDPEAQHAAVDRVRLTLSEFDFLGLLLHPGSAEMVPAPDGGDLADQVRHAWALAHESRYTELTPLLCDLLGAAERAARSGVGSAREQAFGVLADVYQVAAAVMAKLGETDLAWVAADRSVMAAERASTPLQAVAGVYRLAQAFVSGWRLDQAERAASSAALALAAEIHADQPEAVSLYGALNLVRAVVASRRGDGVTAWRAIAEAERAAAMNTVDRNDFDTEFGPTNVALHAVAVAVELGEAAEALRRAGALATDRLSRERQARFLIDVARAHAQRRHSADAVSALGQATALAPEQVRFHPLVRELVRDLVRRERKKRRGVAGHPELHALANTVGVT